jgi:hypothetical protein
MAKRPCCIVDASVLLHFPPVIVSGEGRGPYGNVDANAEHRTHLTTFSPAANGYKPAVGLLLDNGAEI